MCTLYVLHCQEIYWIMEFISGISKRQMSPEGQNHQIKKQLNSTVSRASQTFSVHGALSVSAIFFKAPLGQRRQ